ncbi:MAG: deoxyribonuclease IV [Bacilli bacterium]|nr:deoxyribonuclease IV [Bacilli bacterium]
MSLLGSHVGLSSPLYYLGAVQEALSYKADTFMFYTGAPQNARRKPLDELRIPEGRALIRQACLDESKIVVHAPYIVNLANKDKEETFQGSIEFIQSELLRVSGFGLKLLVLHPGSHVGHGVEHGLDSLILGLSKVLENDSTDVTICLETMAGKGSEVGADFSFFHQFFARFPYPDRVAVCLDTCHVSDAGYDVSDADALLGEFDRLIGLEKLKVVHLNDSKNPRGSHKDRHENLGYGAIGFDALHRFASHPLLKDIPVILETPWVNEKAPYGAEISLLREGKFDPSWRQKL